MRIVQNKFGDWLLSAPTVIGLAVVDSMAMWPGLIVVSTKVDLESKGGRCLMVHEMTHMAQMKRYGWPRQLLMYWWQFGCAWLKCRDIDRAYKLMPFEIEANEEQDKCLAEE